VRLRSLLVPSVAVSAAAVLALTAPATTVAAARSAAGTGAVQQMTVRPAHTHAASTSSNLYYHGGVGGVGVETGSDNVYLVYWGSQWNNNDPSGEAAIQQNFFTGVGGSSWNKSVTQYCEGVAIGSTSCSGGTAATNGPSSFTTSANVWYDNTTSAPRHPSQSQLAGEATTAAAHFGNKTASSNTTSQYVISTAHGFNSRGFGTQYCAWHSSTSSSYGNIAYTNMPYITDAGASCGANFNGLGPYAGITIVGGHEFGETETDIFPNGGWLDSSGAENGDKCAWISSGPGAAANISLSTGTFAVQSLWSNASSGCVLSYP
jgi:hypothetical protein